MQYTHILSSIEAAPAPDTEKTPLQKMTKRQHFPLMLVLHSDRNKHV